MKRFLPKSFLWRTVLMIIIPLILTEVILAYVFFENHWNRVHKWMTRSLSGEIAIIVDYINKNPQLVDKISEQVSKDMGINVSINNTLARPKKNDNHSVESNKLYKELKNKLNLPSKIYIDQDKKLVFIDIKMNDGKILTISTSLNRIYSTSTELFVVWLLLSFIIVSILMTPLILSHYRSIRRIAKAANLFGRGLDMPGFTPMGSKEIREAAKALIIMKNRMNRYNKTRTDMLTAVSHDLKTPLTRIQLAVETDKKIDKKTQSDLISDISRMNEMIMGYLAFARGDVPELEQEVSLASIINRIITPYEKKVKFNLSFPEHSPMFYARPSSLARALDNIIQNATHFADTINIKQTYNETYTTLTIDDNGPGIPATMRAEALKPFVRLDPSRNEQTGGTGLGLCIAQQAIENHGGQLFLEDSPIGGLRVRIVLPI